MRYYIHIPFCASKCRYCHFASFAGKSSLKEKYLISLKKEILAFLESDSKIDKDPDSIYFGWWTPSLLTAEEINSILDTFRWFNGFKNSEITLEANPQNIDIIYLESLIDAGINRLSIWIQSLNPKTLSEIWRCDKDSIVNALKIIQDSRLENIWADFIIGLPFALKWQVESDISEVLDICPKIKHLSIYMLEEWDYPETWKDKWLFDHEYVNEYENVFKLLESRWFKRYELSNWCIPWFECNHNMAYWSHKEYVWFGLWASSFIRGKRKTNASDFKNYFWNKLAFEENLSKGELELEKMMFEIRTIWLDSGRVRNKDFISELEKEGFIKKDGERIVLNPSGVMIADFILGKLI